MKGRNKLAMLAIMIVGIVGCLSFLYFYNPKDIDWFPRCPFLLLTGYKCPGCGTLRGIHSLLHLRLVEAFGYNPLMVLSLPFLFALSVSPKLSRNAFVGKAVLVVILCYWVLRNVWPVDD